MRQLPAWRRPEWPFTTKNDLPLNGPGREQNTLARLLALHQAASSAAESDDEANSIDPLGFPWPVEAAERLQRQHMYERDFYPPLRVTRKWLRVIRKDPWLSSPRQNRSLSRRGIPHSLRPYVWTVAIGSVRVYARNYGSYERLATAPLDEATLTQIDLDVPRTYPSHVWFTAPNPGQSSLRRLLRAFAAYNTYVNYCQSLNFLGGVLLLHLPEELAFWTLVQMIDRRLYGRGLTLCDYYSPDMRGLKRDMFVMGRLMQTKVPEVYALFQSCGADVEWLCSHWLLSLYSTRIPLLLCCRIWDSLILEGDKILFRVSLALVRLIGKRYRGGIRTDEQRHLPGDGCPRRPFGPMKLALRRRHPDGCADGILAVLRGNYELGAASVADVMNLAFREDLTRAEISALRQRFLNEPC